jgi:hypothetical protein
MLSAYHQVIIDRFAGLLLNSPVQQRIPESEFQDSTQIPSTVNHAHDLYPSAHLSIHNDVVRKLRKGPEANRLESQRGVDVSKQWIMPSILQASRIELKTRSAAATLSKAMKAQIPLTSLRAEGLRR